MLEAQQTSENQQKIDEQIEEVSRVYNIEKSRIDNEEEMENENMEMSRILKVSKEKINTSRSGKIPKSGGKSFEDILKINDKEETTNKSQSKVPQGNHRKNSSIGIKKSTRNNSVDKASMNSLSTLSPRSKTILSNKKLKPVKKDVQKNEESRSVSVTKSKKSDKPKTTTHVSNLYDKYKDRYTRSKSPNDSAINKSCNQSVERKSKVSRDRSKSKPNSKKASKNNSKCFGKEVKKIVEMVNTSKPPQSVTPTKDPQPIKKDLSKPNLQMHENIQTLQENWNSYNMENSQPIS